MKEPLFPSEKVFALLKGKAEAADLYQTAGESYPIVFKAGKIKSAESNLSCGAGLRVIVNGKVGFASTNSPNGLESLITRALKSASFGEKADYAMPPQPQNDFTRPETWFSDVAELSQDYKINAGQKAIAMIAESAPDVNIELEVENSVSSFSIANTSGLSLSGESTAYSFGFNLLSVDSNGLLWISDGNSSAKLDIRDEALIRKSLFLLEKAKKVTATPKPEVILMEPSVVGTLASGFLAAINGKTVLKGVSPLSKRIGETITDSSFSLIEDPLLSGRPGSFPFDDEGTFRSRKALIDRGVLKQFVYDMETASKAGTVSTGNGERSYASLPSPGFSNLLIPPGSIPTRKILRDIKNGIWIHSVLGAGQSNMLAGDFSLNAHLAYRIENGEITGRIKDTMISGNIYETFNRITAISSDVNDSSHHHFPAMAFAGITVTG
ncbi:MAG: TldD/PmbA family protein [Fibrobacteres bacterium]|nr:TldD/PmbA family protein [Fibrobacterota bacterium]